MRPGGECDLIKLTIRMGNPCPENHQVFLGIFTVNHIPILLPRLMS
jgi:hypothetical protein